MGDSSVLTQIHIDILPETRQVFSAPGGGADLGSTKYYHKAQSRVVVATGYQPETSVSVRLSVIYFLIIRDNKRQEEKTPLQLKKMYQQLEFSV